MGTAPDGMRPLGTPIGSALTLVAGPDLRPLSEAIATVDRVHGDGPLPTISVVRRPLLAAEAYYHSLRLDIVIGTNAGQPALSLLHELGHALDHWGLGRQGDFATSTGHANLADWRRAVEGTRAWLDLRALRSRYPQARAQTILVYLLRYDELWARSYAQYVATRSGDPTLLAELDTRRRQRAGSRVHLPRQWDDIDFAPVADAIDDLFRRLGWIA
jgi:hypothetical protein